MARDPVKIAAVVVALAVGLLLAISLFPLLLAVGRTALVPSDWAALRFTLVQALWSTTVSCLGGAVLARALHRQRFWSRDTMIRLLSAPFLLPTLAAVMGLLMVFGRSGAVNSAFAAAGLTPISIYGLGGVVLAHVFLNMPLATRIVLQGWNDIPAERLRLAQNLGLCARAQFTLIEWPMLRAALPSAFSAICLICLGSFAVALTLGGGPKASTLELALYQSLRFAFDLDKAAVLALMQIGVGLGMVVLAALLWRPLGFGAGLDRNLIALPITRGAYVLDAAIIGVASLFLLVPMLAVVALGFLHIFQMPMGFWSALGRSVFIAVLAGGLATSGGLALAWARAKGAGVWTELAAMTPLCTSSLALGTGMFIALRPHIAPASIAIPLAVFFGAALTLPFIFRILLQPCRDIAAGYSRLTTEIGLSPLSEVMLVLAPRLSRPLGFCMGLSAAMAMGDFGVIALFGSADQATLPILIAQLMGSYQTNAAAAVTLWLALMSFALLGLFDMWGAKHAAT